ncbi:MAG: hypothetical protein ACREBU_05130 [Nitrososphaera sp.]
MDDSITKLRELIAKNCRVEKVHPEIFASDAEVNIVIVSVVCPDGNRHTIKAFRDEARMLREYIRTMK